MSELFENFEVNKQSRRQIILKLLAGSVVLHVIVGASVLYVPGLRSAFNLASLIADTRFVDKPYERTQIADDVQFIELASDKFHYPDGYFAPEGQMIPIAPAPAPVVPPFIARAQPQTPWRELVVSPSPSLAPVASPTPGASPSPAQAIAKTIAKTNASPTPAPSPTMSADEAQTELDNTAKKNNLDLPQENEINKQVMKDFAAYANDLKKQGKLDFNKPFEIVIEAVLDQNGKLKDAKFTKKAGDENLVDLFGHMVAALNDSGFLSYLKDIDKDNPGSKVVFTIKQGESEVLATVESEASSEESARVLAPVFNKLLSFGASSRKGKDEEALLRNTSAEAVGKKIVFNFTMPRQAVVDLIKKQLAEKPAKAG